MGCSSTGFPAQDEPHGAPLLWLGRTPQRRLAAVGGRTRLSGNGALWESRDSHGMNTVGEPWYRKGPARLDGEVLAPGGLDSWATYAPRGNGRDQPAHLRLRFPRKCLTLHAASEEALLATEPDAKRAMLGQQPQESVRGG